MTAAADIVDSFAVPIATAMATAPGHFN